MIDNSTTVLKSPTATLQNSNLFINQNDPVYSDPFLTGSDLLWSISYLESTPTGVILDDLLLIVGKFFFI